MACAGPNNEEARDRSGPKPLRATYGSLCDGLPEELGASCAAACVKPCCSRPEVLANCDIDRPRLPDSRPGGCCQTMGSNQGAVAEKAVSRDKSKVEQQECSRYCQIQSANRAADSPADDVTVGKGNLPARANSGSFL